MRCRWGDGWRTQERGVNRQGADRLGKHREQGRADEANTGQVWGKQSRAGLMSPNAGQVWRRT